MEQPPTGTPVFAGIDVSKDRLDVRLRPSGEAFAVPRGGPGLDQLLARLRALLAPTGRADTYVALLQEPGRMDAALAWYRARGWAESADPVRVPTRYLWPSDDGTFGETAARGTAAHVAAPYELVVLDDCGHWVADQDPRRVVDALHPFPADPSAT